MPDIVGIRFHGVGKSYDFDANGFKINPGDPIIVETVQGLEMGFAATANHYLPSEKLRKPVKPILRLATEADVAQYAQTLEKEKEAFKICRQLIEEHALDMSLISAEYTFDHRKIVFYFTSAGRIDFRDLVKSLAAIFRIRIELRQIGVRDEARMKGGLGICGREFCCSSYLHDFVPVSIKMAKEQGISMNPTKISGCCGRLMCCLKYEQDAYEDAKKRLPAVKSTVQTPMGSGRVVSVDYIKEQIAVMLESGEQELQIFDAETLGISREPYQGSDRCCQRRGANEKCGCHGQDQSAHLAEEVSLSSEWIEIDPSLDPALEAFEAQFEMPIDAHITNQHEEQSARSKAHNTDARKKSSRMKNGHSNQKRASKHERFMSAEEHWKKTDDVVTDHQGEQMGHHAADIRQDDQPERTRNRKRKQSRNHHRSNSKAGGWRSSGQKKRSAGSSAGGFRPPKQN